MVLVGQFGIISNTNYQTIAGTTIPISSVSGQNTTFTHGEYFVVGIVIGGTTTFLKGMTCLSNLLSHWFNTNDSVSGGFVNNPRAKSGSFIIIDDESS